MINKKFGNAKKSPNILPDHKKLKIYIHMKYICITKRIKTNPQQVSLKQNLILAISQNRPQIIHSPLSRKTFEIFPYIHQQ